MSKNMTALVSAFARAYHYKNNDIKVFSDSIAEEILTEEEYKNIAESMKNGINFFNPLFEGREEEALRWIVNNYLSPSTIGRSAFAENRLKHEIELGASQYLIFAAGYDTFAYRQKEFYKKINIFEIDKDEIISDKIARVKPYLEKLNNVSYVVMDFEKEKVSKRLINIKKFDVNKRSFCSLLGISYYLEKDVFTSLISEISKITTEGSSIVFDYPDENYYSDIAGERAKKQAMMALAAGEEMRSCYSYKELEKHLAEHGFLIYEHLNPEDITEQIFEEFNNANPENKITAFDNVNYLFAVKKPKQNSTVVTQKTNHIL